MQPANMLKPILKFSKVTEFLKINIQNQLHSYTLMITMKKKLR